MILIFTLYSSSDLDKAIGATGYGMFVKLFLFLGGLLAVVKAPAGITEIIGGGELGAAVQLRGLLDCWQQQDLLCILNSHFK